MAMTLITTNSETNAASSSFTSSIDSTYKLYIFKFFDINPATDGTNFEVQFNASGQSDYNETITSTYFGASHGEDGAHGDIGYKTGEDQAQGTGPQEIHRQVGNAADESCAGTLWLFNPSNTTYVKHFYATAISTGISGEPVCRNEFVAGYINVTAAITNVQFTMTSGNFDGTIKMYGVG